MKKRSLLASLLILVVSCSEFSDIRKNPETGELLGINVSLPDFGGFETKSDFIIDNSGVKVVWSENDTLGIFPDVGDQVYFPTISGAGSSSANFNGGGWGLKDANTYSAYFPFNRKYYTQSHDAIRINYDGQLQTGNAGTKHLSDYDYLACASVSPAGGYLKLNLSRIGSIACFRITVPSPGTYTSAVLRSDAGFIVEADMDLSQETPVITPVKTSGTMTLSLKELTTTEENETVTLYMMIYPVDLTSALSFSISLHGEDNSYYSDLAKKNLQAGKPYMFTAQDPTRAISFEDDVVRQICIGQWDTDGNGELGFDEAAAVSDLGNCFTNRRDITSFNELRFFTGLSSVGNQAFSGCSKLASVFLPENLEAIGDGAFKGCISLTGINIPASLAEMGANVFENCSKLSGEIVIPEGTKTIGKGTFSGCSSLSSIIIPDSVTAIEEAAFKQCSGLLDLNLPSGLEFIGNYAFLGCSSLTSLSLPDGAATDVYALFSGCSSLKEINIPTCWTEIGDDYFNGCKSLVSISLPEGIKRIGDRAFSGCTSLSSINLPESILILDEACFNGCSSLEGIVVPSGVSSLPFGCFSGCTKLSSISLPEGLSSISSYACNWYEGTFSECTSLKEIELPESLRSIGAYAFFGAGVKAIAIPDGTGIIGKGAFEGCALEEISLPQGLSVIDSGMLYSTGVESLTIPSSVQLIKPSLPGSLKKIVMIATAPPTLYNEKVIPDNDCPILVPSSSVETYKAAPVWSLYADRIQATSDSGADNPQPGEWG